MFAKPVVRIIITIFLLGLVACTADSSEPTATSTAEPLPTLAANVASTATPTAEPMPTAVRPTLLASAIPGIQSFEDQLMQALEGRDYTQIQGLMGDTFRIAGWRSEGSAYAPGEAIEQLRNNHLDRDAALVFDLNRDLTQLLDGMDPLAILGPDVNQPRAVFVSGWGPEGQDEAILYIAHRADGMPYWHGVLYSFGGFAPATSGEVPDTDTILALPEVDLAVRLSNGHMLMKSTELYRRGSFASYDFVLSESLEYPYLAEIQFFSRESIERFLDRCEGSEYPCFFGDYPDVERYDGQKAAFDQRQDFGQFKLQEIGARRYFVSQHACEGVPCVVREYTTFAGATKVDVWVMMADDSQAEQANALFSQITVQDDWAGIGAMPGPLYTSLDPGVTLRTPLNWQVREEAGDEGAFVSRSISFVPPAFVGSAQPQVPMISLFVYDRPLGDTLQTWLDAYSTDAPFGSAAGPETHFFGVQEIREISSASFLGLEFRYDVLGLTAHELLFAVGPTVVGLSYVELGPEDLRPAFLQIQSSLTRANMPVSARQTEVQVVLAVANAAMYRGPDETFQQIGQVMEGQLALVTGASEDGNWWRVICPNDAIGECWVSADPSLTQPTTPPGAGPLSTSNWTEYRDERYGYGLAVPCHWIRTPPPLEGNYATLTVRSFDEQFRAQNSVKGEWKDGRWPTGAMKLDVTVVEGVPPDQTLTDFVRELLQGGEFTTVESVNEITVGAYAAVSAVTARNDDASDKHTTIAVRMAPDKVLMLNVLPEEAGGSIDILGILGSIALSPAEAVTMPEYPPAPALIAVPEGCLR